MQITTTTFKEVPANAAGIVILGCDVSTQENRDGFLNGVFEFLQEQNVIPKEAKIDEIFEQVLHTTSTGGRNDLIYVVKEDVVKEGTRFNFGRMAMVRLGMGDCSWIEDWLVNYASHYGEARRGPHAGSFMDEDEE